MKIAASLNSRRYETSKVWFVRIADVRNIIRRETSGYMNVKNAVFAPLFGAERLCMAQNCHSDLVYRNAPAYIDQEEFFSQGDPAAALA